ncbi:MAG TPA: MFS transporter [Thermoplasmata archaeon]|nr:MFS transporter [Thermoplasmata archaeon]
MAAKSPTTSMTAAGTAYDPRAAVGVIAVLAGMALMVTYVETMVLPAFRSFGSSFDHPPTTTVVWIVSAYLLVGTVATPIFGKLGDKYGKKQILLLVMSLYAIAVGVAGFVPNLGSALGISPSNQVYLLIGVRAFQGLGMGMFPLAFAMMPEVFPASRVGQAQGIVSGMFAAGASLGLAGGGYLAYEFGWQLTFHTITPVAVALVILAYYFLRESPHLSALPIDLPGITSLGFALAMTLFGLTEGVYWGWTNLTAVTWSGIPWGVPEFFVAAVVGVAVFLYWEPRASTPVISFRAFKERNVWISNVNGVIVGLAMFLIFVTLTILVEDPVSPGFNYNEFQLGIVALPATLGMLAFAPVWGYSVAAGGPRPVMLAGFAMMGLGAAGLAVFHGSIFELELFVVPTMIGNVGVLIAMSNIIVLSVSPEELGIQTGMNQTLRNLGSAVGPVLAATITASYTTLAVVHPPPQIQFASVPTITGFVLLFELTAAVAVIGFVLSLGLRNYRFRADGSRLEAPAPAPETPAPSVVREPIPSARTHPER